MGEAKNPFRSTRSKKEYIQEDYLAPRVRNTSRRYRPTDLETLKEEEGDEGRERDLVYTSRPYRPAGPDLETLMEEEGEEERERDLVYTSRHYRPTDLETLNEEEGEEERGDLEDPPLLISGNQILQPRDGMLLQSGGDVPVYSSSGSSSNSSSQSSSPHSSSRALGNGGVKCSDHHYHEYDSSGENAGVRSVEDSVENRGAADTSPSESPSGGGTEDEEETVGVINPCVARGMAWHGR